MFFFSHIMTSLRLHQTKTRGILSRLVNLFTWNPHPPPHAGLAEIWGVWLQQFN